MRQSAETQWPPIFNHPGNSEFENGNNDIRCPFTLLPVLRGYKETAAFLNAAGLVRFDSVSSTDL